MTVSDLIDILAHLPPDAKVFLPTGDFAGDESRIKSVQHRPNSGYGFPANSVLIDWRSK